MRWQGRGRDRTDDRRKPGRIVRRGVRRAGRRRAPAPAWLQSRASRRVRAFAALGFPTTKNEDWHFTSVAPIAEQEFMLLTARERRREARRARARSQFGATDWHTMVFVNGRFAPELSELGDAADGRDAARSRVGVDDRVRRARAHRASIARYESHAFTALNTRVHARRRGARDREATPTSSSRST